MPWVLKKIENSRLELRNPERRTTGLSPLGPPHMWLASLSGMTLHMSQVSSPVVMSHSHFGSLGSNSSSSLREHSTHCFFWSSLKWYGTNFAVKFLIWRSLCRVLSMVPIERSHAALDSHTVEFFLYTINLFTFAMFWSFQAGKNVLQGLPQLDGSLPAPNCSTHLQTVRCDRQLVPLT